MVTNNKPLVSICIPTYNGTKYLLQALESVKRQSYTNIEVIFSDDSSSDDTLLLIHKFKSEVNVPVYIYSNSKKGIGSNWNNCIKCAQGEYVKFLFQDDVLEYNCIEEMVNVYSKFPQIGLVASKRSFIIDENSQNEIIKQWISKFGDLQETISQSENEILILDNQLFKNKLFTLSPLNKIGEPSTVMFKKSIVKKIGYFRTDLKQVLDYEFWYRILEKNKIVIINKPLVKFRIHQDQATNVNRGNEIKDYYIYDKILYNKYYSLLNPEVQKRLYKKYSFFARVTRKIKSIMKIKI